MNIEEVRTYCLSLKNAVECMPFGDDNVIFRVEGKIFLGFLLSDDEPCVSVKCNADLAIMLRDRYQAVVPGFHMNKKYWNDLYLQRDMPDAEIKRWIKHSYEEVIRKLPKKTQAKYGIKPLDLDKEGI